MRLKDLRLRFDRTSLIHLAVALAIALAAWVFVLSEQSPEVVHKFDNIEIEARGVPEGFSLLRKLGTVTVRARGTSSALRAVESGDFKAYVDLADLPVGRYIRPVHINSPDPELTLVSYEPITVEVDLEPRIVENASVQILVNGAASFGYQAGVPVADPARVSIAGPQNVVRQVARVVGAVNVDGRQSTTSGSVELAPVDKAGQPVSGVTISPSTVDVTVPIELREAVKTVPVEVNVQGAVADGYWLSATTVSPATVTIRGNPNLVGPIAAAPTVPIDVSGLQQSIQERVELALPEGVSLVRKEPVLVELRVSTLQGRISVPVAVEVQGLPSNLSAQVSPSQVALDLSGPVLLLQVLKPTDLHAVVSLSGASTGTFSMAPGVTLPPGIGLVSVRPERVAITLLEAPTATPTSTSTPTVTPSPTPRR